jgi:hypothetical protein
MSQLNQSLIVAAVIALLSIGPGRFFRPALKQYKTPPAKPVPEITRHEFDFEEQLDSPPSFDNLTALMTLSAEDGRITEPTLYRDVVASNEKSDIPAPPPAMIEPGRYGPDLNHCPGCAQSGERRMGRSYHEWLYTEERMQLYEQCIKKPHRIITRLSEEDYNAIYRSSEYRVIAFALWSNMRAGLVGAYM